MYQLRLASDLKVPLSVVEQACNVFSRHAQLPDGRSAEQAPEEQLPNALITKDAFCEALRQLAGYKKDQELPEVWLKDSFGAVDAEGDAAIDFRDFAFWYSRHGFSEELVVSAAEKEIRDFARRYGMPLFEAEQYKNHFDRVDTSGRGRIGLIEFEQLVCNLTKAPPSERLPPSRLNMFWKDVDPKSSGSVEFEDFMAFWMLHFEGSDLSSGDFPWQNFYRNFNPLRQRGMEESV